MYIDIGSTVVITDVDQPQLAKYIGSTWQVKNILHTYYPASALLYHPIHGEINLSIRCIEVIPPEGSPLSHDEFVKIAKPYAKEAFHTCRTELVGKTGRVRGYDTRNGYYFVKTTVGDSGWFPLKCLVPLAFRGERFYYPEQEVLYENKKVKILQIRKTHFGNGQLLYIDGSWIPSTDVKPVS